MFFIALITHQGFTFQSYKEDKTKEIENLSANCYHQLYVYLFLLYAMYRLLGWFLMKEKLSFFLYYSILKEQ